MNNNDIILNGKSIYNENALFGFRYNVNHPYINNLYRRYKKWKGIPESSPMSNEQRREFEIYLDGLFSSQLSIN